MSDHKIRIGITMGDFNGIGPEVILKGLSDPRLLESIIPVIYGSAKVMSYYRKLFNLGNVSFQTLHAVSEMDARKINLINCINEEMQVEPGTSSAVAGKAAFQCLEKAVTDLKSGHLDALVTAPINKKNIQSRDFQFPGHTEYLQQAFGVNDTLMFMVSESFRLGVATGHIPLKEVPSHITVEVILSKLRLMARSLLDDFNIASPRIAVLSLNPHAGDEGLLGSEEIEVITPAITQAKEEGMLVFGPYPSDGFFGSSLCSRFDAVLAMYHDQGLTPFKALCAAQGVNFTAGLPVVRTSPAHGTAYDLAGKDLADCDSFRSAVYMAEDIVRGRTARKEILKNRMI
ncbi:MAG: 4-hydroxythreonine-4-phosphate dehydrogenase PdxA [Bacteroidales bacterium]|nr:4-hydroxythreonine-4-phosphate dehydrogenase PdxA [Bacteroidales bacterium]